MRRTHLRLPPAMPDPTNVELPSSSDESKPKPKEVPKGLVGIAAFFKPRPPAQAAKRADSPTLEEQLAERAAKRKD